MDKDSPLVLIVDDNPTNIDILVNTLNNEYRLGIAKNGPKAIEYAQKNKPDLILLDIMMPDMNGYEVCSRLKEDPNTSEIVVIFITAMSEAGHKTKGFEVGAVDYVTKPFHATEIKARVRTHLSRKKMREELSAQNIILEKKVAKKTAQLQEMLEATIQAMDQMLECRDPYTAGHEQRVAQFSCEIAKLLGLSEKTIKGIQIAGILHDIGKIRIPVSILNRPGKLLDVEFELIKIHPQIGYDLLKNIPSPWPFAEMLYQHHERINGRGYPLGLKGDQILPEAKILAVADVIEAMSSHRPYRPALGIEAALKELDSQRGEAFDSDVVDVCIKHFSQKIGEKV